MLTALIGGRVERVLSRDDAQARGLGTQIEGWTKLSTGFQEQVAGLREEIADLRAEVLELRASNKTLEKHNRDCNRRLAKYEQENAQLLEWVTERGSRMGEQPT